MASVTVSIGTYVILDHEADVLVAVAAVHEKQLFKEAKLANGVVGSHDGLATCGA